MYIAPQNPAQLRVHPLNPRASRPQADIDKLAERMRRIGFEATRAPWIVDGLVFAGATRVAAAVAAGLTSIPVVVHEQLTDEDVVRLADQDNESDEYHVRVPLLDTWASYAALADAGWTQERRGQLPS
jgi:ParB-like chromosome segregation protein Spo0J